MIHSPFFIRSAPNRLTARAMAVRADSADDATKSVEAILSTAAQTTVFDWERFEYIDEILSIPGASYPDQIPLLDSHNRYTVAAVFGSVRQIRADADYLVGRLFFAEDADSQTAWTKVRGKHVRDVSIGYEPIQFIDIEPGQSADVAGKTYTAGPRLLRVTTRFLVKELSLCAIGADPGAKTRGAATMRNRYRVRADHPLYGRAGTIVELENRYAHPLVRDGILERIKAPAAARAGQTNPPAASATPPRVPSSRADSDPTDDEQEPAADDAARADGDPTDDEEEPDADDEMADDGEDDETDDEERSYSGASLPRRPIRPAPARATQARSASDGPPTPAAIRDAMRVERHRISEINRLAGQDVPRRLVTQAIERGWTVNRASREFLGEIRRARRAPAGHAHSHDQLCTARALGTALIMRSGGRPVNPNAPETERQAQERAAETAHQYRDMSLVDICREAVRLDGHQPSHNRGDMIRAAVSGSTLTGIFTTNVNAILLQSFLEVGDSTQGWCQEADVPDFKTNERLRMGKSAGLERLARGKEANHATIADKLESYKIARYAKQFVVDEQDIIDDSLGAIVTMPREMGLAAARLRPDLVYSLLLANAALIQDSIALFHASHANLGTTGTALSATTLQTAITNMAKQTEDGVTLNVAPAFLIVPQDLRFAAQILLTSAERIISADSGGTYNPLKDMNITLRADNRIGVAGVTDPVTGTARVGTATNYFLAASPATGPTIEVGHLRGTNRQPVVRPFVLDRGQWGIGWDINYDIGAKALGYQGLYKATGAA